MAQRYVIPPETEKEKFALGLNLPQLMWLAGGIALGFGGFMLTSSVIENVWFSIAVGFIVGLIVVPFIFIRPKKRTMSLVSFFRYKWKIKHRNNILPNRRKNRSIGDKDKSNILSTDKSSDSESNIRAQDVADVNITLGGGE